MITTWKMRVCFVQGDSPVAWISFPISGHPEKSVRVSLFSNTATFLCDVLTLRLESELSGTHELRKSLEVI